MAVAKPPDDAELKNIIEKLGQFVARNGASFEAMTKSKQKDNPRFSFLFGGEGHDYYTYRVTTEQVRLWGIRQLTDNLRFRLSARRLMTDQDIKWGFWDRSMQYAYSMFTVLAAFSGDAMSGEECHFVWERNLIPCNEEP